MSPHDRTTHDGKEVDMLTKGLLLEMERHLGYALSLYQGSFRPGSNFSANTHKGGGAFDLLPFDWGRKVSVGRELGAAIWHRPPIKNLWVEHCHGIVIGDDIADPSAKAQVTDYFNGRDGLAGNGPDKSWHPSPIPTWTWAKAQASLKKPAWNAKPAPKPAPRPAANSEHLAIDYSFARPNPSSIKAAGYRGVLRYLSTAGNRKNLSKAEAASLFKQGLWIGLVWETFGNRAGAGKAAGIADAKAAEKMAASLGYPKTACIFYAVDYDATAAAVKPYFDGAKSVAKHPVGAYGGFKVIDAGLAPWGWQTEAWSWSGGKLQVSSKANLLQRLSHSHAIVGSATGDWDENLCVRGIVPVWTSGKPAPPPPPAPKPKPVPKPAPAPVPTPKLSPELWNGQFNSQQTDPSWQSTKQLRETIPLAGVWGLNEISTTWQRAALKALKDYDIFPLVGVAGDDPIVWRKSRYQALSKETITVHKGQKGVTEQRQINRVTFKFIPTGQTFTRLNTHVVHHIETNGKPMVYSGREKTLFAAQQGRAKLHFQMLHDQIVKWSKVGPVVCGGDFNVDYHADKAAKPRTPWFPYTVLTPVITPVMPAGGTQGNRAIDWTLITGINLHARTQEELVQGYSDHRAVITKITFL